MTDTETPATTEALGTNGAPAPDTPAPTLSPDDVRFVAHLHFEHLRNLTTLSVSATGGGLLALQAGLLDLGPFIAVPLLCFAFAAVLSLLTQRSMIRDLGTTGALSGAFAWMSEMSAALFGAGVGSVVAILLMEQVL